MRERCALVDRTTRDTRVETLALVPSSLTAPSSSRRDIQPSVGRVDGQATYLRAVRVGVGDVRSVVEGLEELAANREGSDEEN